MMENRQQSVHVPYIT